MFGCLNTVFPGKKVGSFGVSAILPKILFFVHFLKKRLLGFRHYGVILKERGDECLFCLMLVRRFACG